MAKLVVEVPELLGEEMGKIEREVKELISLEEKRKLLSLFIDEVMKGAKQLSEEELVELGREVKRGRFEKLKQLGLV
jgi:SpoVK/Ycf46/Vps4 family AAA+-type ATPase